MPSPTCVRILLLLNSRKAEALVIYLFIYWQTGKYAYWIGLLFLPLPIIIQANI